MTLPLGGIPEPHAIPPEGEANAPRRRPRARAVEAPIPVSMEAATLEHYLRRVVHRPVRLTINKNRRQLISFKDDRSGMRHVRMSDVFLDADPLVWREIALWIKDTRAHRLFQQGSASRAFIDRADVVRSLHQRKKPRPDPPVRGEHHNLQRVFDDINRRYFNDRCRCRIGWKRVASRPGTRSIQLGSYHAEENLILIHPVLDTPLIPRYVLEDTVFHEMVHWVLRDRCHADGRRMIHSAEFHRMMDRYPRHVEAEVWVAENIRTIIRRKNRLIRERRALRRVS